MQKRRESPRPWWVGRVGARDRHSAPLARRHACRLPLPCATQLPLRQAADPWPHSHPLSFVSGRATNLRRGSGGAVAAAASVQQHGLLAASCGTAGLCADLHFAPSAAAQPAARAWAPPSPASALLTQRACPCARPCAPPLAGCGPRQPSLPLPPPPIPGVACAWVAVPVRGCRLGPAPAGRDGAHACWVRRRPARPPRSGGSAAPALAGSTRILPRTSSP